MKEELLYETEDRKVVRYGELLITTKLYKQDTKLKLIIRWDYLNSRNVDTITYNIPYRKEYEGKNGTEIYKDLFSKEGIREPWVRDNKCRRWEAIM